MRITFVLPCFDLSGGVRVVAQYAEALQRRGHDVFAIARPPEPVSLRRRGRALVRQRRWLPQPVQGASHFDATSVPHVVLPMFRDVRESDVPDADVIVATWWETAEWVARMGACKGAKAHFIQGDEAHPQWVRSDLIARAESVHRLPLAKITISGALERVLRARYGVTDVVVIRNGIDVALFHAPPRSKQPVPTVGLLYATMALKGCDVALRAVDEVRRVLPGLRVVAFGAETIDPSLPLPAGASFELRPSQARIRELYAHCDVWLCGSRSEGFHLPPLEAMACRCPVVSTRVGGPADVIADGIDGHLVDVEDVGALADRLRRVLEAPEAAWRELSDAAHRTARAYTQEDATDRFESVLLERVARTTRAAA